MVKRMSKHLLFSTGVAAFTAGIAVGARWPHSTHILGLLLDKLGFDISEIVLGLWDPEARERAALERQLPAPHARAKKSPKAPSVAIRESRRPQPRPESQVVIKVRRFSSRPALSAA